MTKRILLNNILNCFLSLFMSISLAYALTTSLYLPFSFIETFGATAILLLLFAVLFFNKRTIVFSSIALLALILAGIVFLLLKGWFFKFIYYFAAGCFWLIDYMRVSDNYIATFGICVFVLLCSVVTLGVYFFTLKKFNFLVIFISGISIFTIQWINAFFESYIAFYIFIIVVLIYYLRYIYISNSSKTSNEYASPLTFMFWSVPVCAFVLAISFLIPASSSPIQWKWMDKKINSLVLFIDSKINGAQSQDFFSLASTGLGESGSRLGGKVKLDKTIILNVDSPRQVYLKGNICDFYTGFSWLNTSKETEALSNPNNALFYDFNEALNEMASQGLLGQLQVDKYFNVDDITITYQNIKTKSLFFPVKTRSLNLPVKTLRAFADENSALSFEKAKGKDFKYSLDVYNLKLNEADFKKYLRTLSKGYYFEKYLRSFRIIDTNDGHKIVSRNESSTQYTFNYELYERYASSYAELVEFKTIADKLNSIYSKYLQLPDNLPNRVSDLAASVTASSTNDYDRIKAVEEYLSKNYQYTLSPKSTPKNSDFVDNFLFNEKQGYCTYFASALTVLVRSIGIPARYVEGYMLPSRPKTGRTYEVTNEDAHAWVEVYLEGFGWLPFEPTSPFSSSFYNNRDYSASFSRDFASNPSYYDYMRKLQGYGNSNIDLDLIEENNSNTKKLTVILIICIGFSFLLLLFFGIVVFNLLFEKLSLRKIKKMNSKDSVLRLYEKYLKILCVHELIILPGETPHMFSGRVQKKLIFNHIRFQDVTNIFVSARYGIIETPEKDKRVMFEFYNALIQKTLQEIGKNKFFFYRYVWKRL